MLLNKIYLNKFNLYKGYKGYIMNLIYYLLNIINFILKILNLRLKYS